MAFTGGPLGDYRELLEKQVTLIFCKAEASEKGEISNSTATKALQLIKGGKVE